MIKNILLSILTIGVCLLPAQEKINTIYDEKSPVLIIGSDEVNESHPFTYKAIQFYCIDQKGNIYIGDREAAKIDKYDAKGNYLYSIGRKGQGPGEFEGIGSFTVDKNGRLLTYTNRKYFMMFDENGKYLNEIKFPEEFTSDHPATIKADNDNNIYVLIHSYRRGMQIVKFNNNLKEYRTVHKDPKRKPLDGSRISFLPPINIDYDVDGLNNLYVTDAFDYTIYQYSNRGKLLRTFSKDEKREWFTKRDLIINFGKNTANILDQNPDTMKELKEKKIYAPRIFGINVDDDKIFVWTTRQDKEYRYVIDIYDQQFNFLRHAYFYDFMPGKMVLIKNRKIYTPNLQSGDRELKKAVGRLSVFNIPYFLSVYDMTLDKNGP